CQCHKAMHSEQGSKKFEIREIRITPGITCYARKMHWKEEAVHSGECQEKVNFSECFVQHPPKHERKPVESGGKEGEYRRDSHDEMKVGDYEVRVVEIQIENRLSEEDATEAAGDEHGNETKREQHGGREPNLAAPQRSKPVQRFDGRGYSN